MGDMERQSGRTSTGTLRVRLFKAPSARSRLGQNNAGPGLPIARYICAPCAEPSEAPARVVGRGAAIGHFPQNGLKLMEARHTPRKLSLPLIGGGAG